MASQEKGKSQVINRNLVILFIVIETRVNTSVETQYAHLRVFSIQYWFDIGTI